MADRTSAASAGQVAQPDDAFNGVRRRKPASSMCANDLLATLVWLT
jgi:hypothetical protein